jgi:hypothetical protein
VDGFDAAARCADLLLARPWTVFARAGLAEAMLSRGAPGDHARALDLLRDVVEEARDIGMSPIADRSSRLLRPVTPEAGYRSNVFRFDGVVWTLSFAGRTAVMPDAKGLHDLHTLLASPRSDVPATTLIGVGSSELSRAIHALGSDPVLDGTARGAYRHRLAQLDELIDAALESGRDDTAAEADRERAALIEAIAQATGLHGRTRHLGDETERARKTVRARVADVLRRLDSHHPELAAYLRSTVSTGGSCRYEPHDAGTHWEL